MAVVHYESGWFLIHRLQCLGQPIGSFDPSLFSLLIAVLSMLASWVNPEAFSEFEARVLTFLGSFF